MPRRDRMAQLDAVIARFARERNWGKYHKPKNLAMAMVKEAAEVVEIFQWLTPAQAGRLSASKRAHLAEELADVYVYLKKLAGCYRIDLVEAAHEKMAKNALKYPVHLNRGQINKR
ncbi:MAG: nucleotide pyrophosphohydrolase [Elusimicrobiota bacterium]|nr:MAG: nucleotide pyrophosphohydrolase [Elusimicrobiota bacterium]